MRRLWVFAFALFLGVGCAAEGEKSQWDEFKKDLRGDNMEMRGFGRTDKDRRE